MNRKSFIKLAGIAGAGIVSNSISLLGENKKKTSKSNHFVPIVISTWNMGLGANEGAWKVLSSGGDALTAVEQGVWIPEADPKEMTVGLGGFPDREGRVTLDACVMRGDGACGAVLALENIVHPVSVARAVMEKTPHVILTGEGALQFALQQGFKKENLLTPESEKAWKDWLKKSEYKPIINIENHDTIGMLAIDQAGKLAGACTTSGMAFKMRGRIGDSPIIGAGLFVDEEVGGATATGHGEEVIRIAGSHLVVELMRQGKSPEAACKEAVDRVYKRQKHRIKDIQVGFIAVSKEGEYGAYCVHKGFSYAVKTAQKTELIPGKYLID
jgi:isoaspartyl peptidase/L-asparaginase-like protein (Ntn-hydrolase superfamily)